MYGGAPPEPSKPVYKKAWFWIVVSTVVGLGVGAVLCNPKAGGGDGGDIAADGSVSGGDGGSFSCAGPGAYGSGLTYDIP